MKKTYPAGKEKNAERSDHLQEEQLNERIACKRESQCS